MWWTLADRHPGICARSRNRIAEHFRIVAQQTRQGGDGRLPPSGRHVINDQSPVVGRVQRRLQHRQLLAIDDQGLVGQHIDARLDGGEDPLSLAAVAAGKDRHRARALMAHPLEEIRAGMDLELPVGRLLLTRVEAGNPCQIVGEVGPDRRIDVHRWREVRVHLLLHESGMKMAGVGDDQPDVGHKRSASRIVSGSLANRGGGGSGPARLNGRGVWDRGRRARRRQRG